MLKSAFGGLSTGVCRQPQWTYVGVFMYWPGGAGSAVGVVSYNSRGYRFLMFAGISAGILSLYPRGGTFPRFRGFIRGFSFPVPARRHFSAFPRVYSRVFFPCTRAVILFRTSTGLFAGFLSLYPRGDSFPRFRGFIRGFSFPVPARCLCIHWLGGAGSTVGVVSYNSRGATLSLVLMFLRGLLFTVSHAYAV